jgi:hypothetical protein
MYSYPWDFQADGVTAVVAQLQNIGINSVTLAGSYHAGKFLRPKGKNEKSYFPEGGTTYFETNAKNYGAIKRAPHSKAGDPYIYSFCPSAPDSRAYGVGLAKDVSDNYDISGIGIESIGFPPYEHGFHHEMSFVKPNKWLSSYLGLCFCKHCLKGAKEFGVDADKLKAQVAKKIEDYFAGDIDFPADMAEAFWLADVVANSELRRYLDFRNSVVTSLAKEIRETVRSDVEVAIIPSVARPTGGACYEGTDLKAVVAVTGVIEACFYEPATERIQADLVDLKRRTENIGKIKGKLRPTFPDVTNKNAVVEAVRALREGGVSDIGFYNYGHIRSQSLDWISAALKSKGDQ